jgi:hypothetical protein
MSPHYALLSAVVTGLARARERRVIGAWVPPRRRPIRAPTVGPPAIITWPARSARDIFETSRRMRAHPREPLMPGGHAASCRAEARNRWWPRVGAELVLANACALRHPLGLYPRTGRVNGAPWSNASLTRRSADVLRRVAGIDVLQHARAAGKPRQLGYIGDGEAARYTAACGAFDTLQTFLNLADQEANRTDIRHGGTAIASRPTGSRDTSPLYREGAGRGAESAKLFAWPPAPSAIPLGANRPDPKVSGTRGSTPSPVTCGSPRTPPCARPPG